MEPTKKVHWENVYTTKNENSVSWYTSHLDHSLAYIHKYASLEEPIIDIGGGASTLPDDLLKQGYRDITVLDISDAALNVSRSRLSQLADSVRWLTGDITKFTFPPHQYSLWHDRAVFHFLTQEEEQRHYIDQMYTSLRPKGIAVMATFGPDGPTTCSNLPTARYSAQQLASVLGAGFTLLEETLVTHTTPFNTQQQFQYSCFQKE